VHSLCLFATLMLRDNISQEDAASPDLRVGLTPHIKSLRACLAAESPSSAPSQAASSQDRQRHERRASLAEAARPNLLFEPVYDGEALRVSPVLLRLCPVVL